MTAAPPSSWVAQISFTGLVLSTLSPRYKVSGTDEQYLCIIVYENDFYYHCTASIRQWSPSGVGGGGGGRVGGSRTYPAVLCLPFCAVHHVEL